MFSERSVYMPTMSVIEDIVELTDDDRLFTIQVSEQTLRACMPGQFVQVWVPGVGECPISVCCGQVADTIQLCVRRAGRVTNALFGMQVGEEVGLRGPYGHGFPVNEMRGKNVVMVAGGLGIAPIRSVWQYVLAHRADFGRVVLVYGARKLTDLLFADELEDLAERGDIELDIAAEETEASDFCEIPIFKGVITKPIRAISLDSSFVAVICGPPGMYKYVVEELRQKNLSDDQIFLSLERHMKCGIGKCGHCFVGGLFTCKQGPVFSCEHISGWPEAMECA